MNSYHDHGIKQDSLPDELEAFAFYDDHEVEAFVHKKHAVAGIMWHPERNDPFQRADVLFFRSFLNVHADPSDQQNPSPLTH